MAMMMTMKRCCSDSAILLGLGLVALVSSPLGVAACGGFWCSQQLPVNQASENIIFAFNATENKITAVVQIMYQGPSEEFAWLLPVPGVPDVTVSSNVVFDNLQRATDPEFNLNLSTEGECIDGGDTTILRSSNNQVDGVPLSGGGVAEDSAGGGVTVEAQETVGPYDYVVISVDNTLAEPADVAIEWLQTNEYDVLDSTSEVIEPYLEDGMNLIAFRLTKTAGGADIGAIRPIVMTYDGDKPMIPIRPTAVAANDDMGIRVWILSSARAVPENYKTLVPNLALINWFNWQSTYDQVVTEAANEAGGQGFVTEMATSTEDSMYRSIIFDAESYETYLATDFENGFDAIAQAGRLFRDYDGWQEAIEKSVTLPDGVTVEAFGRFPFNYQDQVTVDQDLFLSCLETDVVAPVRAAQELFDEEDYSYMTRLYTTMSDTEMTEDPVFVLNTDLPDVSNIHWADITILCKPDIYFWQAPWRITLANGGVIDGFDDGSRIWPIDFATSDFPANEQVWALSASGAGSIVEDNNADIVRLLENFTATTSSSSSQWVEMTSSTGPITWLIGCIVAVYIAV